MNDADANNSTNLLFNCVTALEALYENLTKLEKYPNANISQLLDGGDFQNHLSYVTTRMHFLKKATSSQGANYSNNQYNWSEREVLKREYPVGPNDSSSFYKHNSSTSHCDLQQNSIGSEQDYAVRHPPCDTQEIEQIGNSSGQHTVNEMIIDDSLLQNIANKFPPNDTISQEIAPIRNSSFEFSNSSNSYIPVNSKNYLLSKNFTVIRDTMSESFGDNGPELELKIGDKIFADGWGDDKKNFGFGRNERTGAEGIFNLSYITFSNPVEATSSASSSPKLVADEDAPSDALTRLLQKKTERVTSTSSNLNVYPNYNSLSPPVPAKPIVKSDNSLMATLFSTFHSQEATDINTLKRTGQDIPFERQMNVVTQITETMKGIPTAERIAVAGENGNDDSIVLNRRQTEPMAKENSPLPNPKRSDSDPMQLNKKDNEVYFALTELIEMEENFCRQLGYVIKHILDAPLPDSIQQYSFQIKSVFKGFKELHAHSSAITESFKLARDGHYAKMGGKELTGVYAVASVFAQFIFEFLIFPKYVADYCHAKRKLAELQQKKKFQLWLTDIMSKPCFMRQDINHFLVLPIRHVPRYPLILSRLRKISDKDHPHFKILDVAEQFVVQLANKMDQVEAEEDQMLKMFEICTKEITNCPQSIISHKRQFLATFKIVIREILLPQLADNNIDGHQKSLDNYYASNIDGHIANPRTAKVPSGSVSSPFFSKIYLFSDLIIFSNFIKETNKNIFSKRVDIGNFLKCEKVDTELEGKQDLLHFKHLFGSSSNLLSTGSIHESHHQQNSSNNNTQNKSILVQFKKKIELNENKSSVVENLGGISYYFNFENDLEREKFFNLFSKCKV
ncbi:hypothetical protein HDU92_004722 [Lobulomyces angularis]|nr:hypothetical protein HDU92_004722 [Lobulomyces angularis]